MEKTGTHVLVGQVCYEKYANSELRDMPCDKIMKTNV